MDQIVGIIKEIDALGRIVIPKEFRQRLMLEKEVEVILTKDGILIRNSKFQLTEKNKKSRLLPALFILFTPA